jgi:hypothetical protein
MTLGVSVRHESAIGDVGRVGRGAIHEVINIQRVQHAVVVEVRRSRERVSGV